MLPFPWGQWLAQCLLRPWFSWNCSPSNPWFPLSDTTASHPGLYHESETINSPFLRSFRPFFSNPFPSFPNTLLLPLWLLTNDDDFNLPVNQNVTNYPALKDAKIDAASDRF